MKKSGKINCKINTRKIWNFSVQGIEHTFKTGWSGIHNKFEIRMDRNKQKMKKFL